jgi:hypothetical protein
MKVNNLIKNSKVIATLIIITVGSLLYINPKIVVIILFGIMIVALWWLLVVLIELFKNI